MESMDSQLVLGDISISIGDFHLRFWKYYFLNYLNIMYIPNSEMTVFFIAAFELITLCTTLSIVCFMGDTGSLTIGGIIAVLLQFKELLIPLCGVFLVENLSVVLQVSYFKYTKTLYEGRRIPRASSIKGF
jgi:phospho-N-acetylmuramoyl-pentapeptide-transferase